MAKNSIEKKKPGPKPKGPFKDRSAVLTTRLSQETRDALEEAAEKSGRSLGQEAEFRIMNSLISEKRALENTKEITAAVIMAFGLDEPAAMEVLNVFIGIFIKNNGPEFLLHPARRREFGETINSILRTFDCDFSHLNIAEENAGKLWRPEHAKALLNDVIKAFKEEEEIRDIAHHQSGGDALYEFDNEGNEI